MRQGHQNKRMRGRGRKSGNPLTKTYDSSGPDVKIRGSAQHIADKYAQLSRDAHSSGDRIMSENYLQHAEHYHRLIAAAQAHIQQQQQQQHGGRDDDNRMPSADAQTDRVERTNGAGPVMQPDTPQPVVEAMPALDGNAANGAIVPIVEAKSPETPDMPARESAADASGVGDDPAPKPRRRTRSPRNRNAKSSDVQVGDQSAAQAGPEDAAQTESETTADSEASDDTVRLPSGSDA